VWRQGALHCLKVLDVGGHRSVALPLPGPGMLLVVWALGMLLLLASATVLGGKHACGCLCRTSQCRRELGGFDGLCH